MNTSNDDTRIKKNFEDIDYLARTIFGEARGETIAGQVAVGWVILNRVVQSRSRKQFGDGTVKSAVLKPWQFSCWNKGDPNYPLITDPDLVNNKDFLKICTLATKLLDGAIKDPTNNANHYYAINSKIKPSWAMRGTDKITIGGHIFMKA